MSKRADLNADPYRLQRAAERRKAKEARPEALPASGAWTPATWPEEPAAVHLKISRWEALSLSCKLYEHLQMPSEAFVAEWEALHPRPKSKRAAKPKRQSRSARWAEAVSSALAAKTKVEEAFSELQSHLEVLAEIKSEFEEWRDNLPENLQSSPLGEKLDAVCDLDFDVELDMDLSGLEEADGIDLPQGFGRD